MKSKKKVELFLSTKYQYLYQTMTLVDVSYFEYSTAHCLTAFNLKQDDLSIVKILCTVIAGNSTSS